ncbi:MAG TPA: helix-turn-helix domain-containing protein [Streptosporangiaceae bacterium]
MSIGETLARARRDAGLSVADISQRTRIRESFIEHLEHDDYPASGIDLFARGEIREIARAVGVDSKPLIEEYDASRPPAGPVWELAGPVSVRAKLGDALRSVITDLRQRNWIWRLALALLVVAALGGILLIRGTAGTAGPHVSAAARHQLGARTAAHQAASQHASAAHAARSPAAAPSPTPGSSNLAQVLAPSSIAAFGPAGTSHGDSPQLANLAVKGKAATPWHSDWYATPQFGNLQSGTGLLLDMGRTVTVTGARIALGYGPGAALDLRIGSTPTLARMRTVAHMTNASHEVLMHLQPTRGRYVLVWFTRLPPDQAGTFQASVYDIKVLGYR